ncbi:MAG: DUF1292 domain-containing protein [Firmicutes bacterium]|nr:DUF1292 domain-containing protein [Bacillota bacterium]
MSHQHEEDNWIILEDENNQQYRYSFERTLELDDKTYVILVPEEQEDPEVEEAHVFRLENDENNEEILVEIDDDELERIQQYLETEADAGAFDEDEGETDEEEDDGDSALTETAGTGAGEPRVDGVGETGGSEQAEED